VEIKYWNKNRIEKEIDIVDSWAMKNNIPYIFAGEFSVVRWAENKDIYLEDILDILEAKHMGWAYFSFNGWKGWDYQYELNSDQQRNTNSLYRTNTVSEKILNQYWSLNKAN
jgi:hypothetical protein